MNDIGVSGVRFLGVVKIVLLCFLICIGASAGVGAAAPKGVRSIGIVSAIGDKFYVRKVGLMVFGNDTKEFPIDSWRIDDLVVSKARGLLSKSYDVRAVTYRRAAIAAAPISRSGLGDTLRAEVSPKGLDAYVVVTKVPVQYGGTNQSISGLGIVEGPFDHYFIYSILRVVLVDGREFSTLAQSIAALPGDKPCNSILAKPFICGANREVDKTWWPASLDAASNQRLKGAMVEFIDKSLPNTLRQLELTN